MKIPYKHISNRIESSPSIEEISENLFQLGHEHEIFDNIFDIEITPNRGDCISLNGILRDLSIFYEIGDSKSIFEGKIDDFKDLEFQNHSTNTCKKISFLKIEVDKIKNDYESELKDYFQDLKLNRNNFFTDISNFILYETGQPTHCYDLAKIEPNLSLSNENYSDELSFKTLFGKTIKLIGKNLVFKMQGEVINLAGVIGGASTACDNQTQSVLIECAYFDPESIIGKSLKYDINSDAAYKFERGADINCHEEILRRFIHIVEKHANIINVEIFTKDYSDIKFPEIEYDHDKIIKILGYDISRDKCILFLENLGFQLNGDYLQVPSFRNDIVGINDIAEEIARAVGYNQFPNSELNLVSIETQNNQTKLERCLKSYLTDNGFYEVINNPFTDKNSKDSIAIDNPLDSNRDQMRTSLKDALIENLLYNEKRQKESIKLFEISDTYFIDENKNIKNIRKLGLIGSGRRGLNYIDFSNKIDSDYFETLLKPYFEEKNIQVLAKDELNTKNKDDIIFFETQLSNISKEIFEYSLNYTPKYSYNYEKISDFPISIRDLSFAISDQTKLIDLENTVLNFNDPFLKDVYVFDFFNNAKKGELKIGFRFIFQSQDETLKDFQVDNVIKDIVKQALKIESVKIPGLK